MVVFSILAFFGELQGAVFERRLYWRYFVYLKVISASKNRLIVAFWLIRESGSWGNDWPEKWRGSWIGR